MEFAVPVDYRVKSRESDKSDKYLDIAKELKKKLWNMKEMMMPIVIGLLGTILKSLVKGLEELEIRGQLETIQTTAF